MVDDGSTDDTRELVSGVSDPRLRLLADTNHGPAHARNQGCRAARATELRGVSGRGRLVGQREAAGADALPGGRPHARRGRVLHALRLVVGQGHGRDRPDPPSGGPSPGGRGGAVPVPHVEPDRPAISARAKRALRRVLSVCRLGGSRFSGPTRVRGSAAVRPSRPGVVPHPPGQRDGPGAAPDQRRSAVRAPADRPPRGGRRPDLGASSGRRTGGRWRSAGRTWWRCSTARPRSGTAKAEGCGPSATPLWR